MTVFTFALIGLVSSTLSVASGQSSAAKHATAVEKNQWATNFTFLAKKGADECPLNMFDEGTGSENYPKPAVKSTPKHTRTRIARARNNNNAGPARLFVKMLKRLLKVRFPMRASFGFNKKVKIAEGVPLISQNQHHRENMPAKTTDTDLEKRSAAHSCWAYARVIALYHAGKWSDYMKQDKLYSTYSGMTPWKTAEEMFWKHTEAGRSNPKNTKKEYYEGDSAFIPKGKCPYSIDLAKPESITKMGTDLVCEVISGLMENKIFIAGLGRCGETTDHYSNVIGFTSNLDEDTKFSSEACVTEEYNADLTRVKGLQEPEKANLEKKLSDHQQTKKNENAKKVYSPEKKIFESICHWKKYCESKVADIPKHFHLIIAEPWCDEMTGPEQYNRHGFYHKKEWTNSNCATGPKATIKKGGSHGTCALAGQPVTEWKCIKEVPFKIKAAETKDKDESKWWNENCKNKNMLEFTNDGKDVLRNAAACVLGSDGNHWGYAQYLWKV